MQIEFRDAAGLSIVSDQTGAVLVLGSVEQMGMLVTLSYQTRHRVAVFAPYHRRGERYIAALFPQMEWGFIYQMRFGGTGPSTSVEVRKRQITRVDLRAEAQEDGPSAARRHILSSLARMEHWARTATGPA